MVRVSQAPRFREGPEGPRIIYTRFHTKSSNLLRRIKNQNIEAEIQKLIVETLGPLQGKHEVFKDGAIKCRLPLLESMELQKICRFFKRKFVRALIVHLSAPDN